MRGNRRVEMIHFSKGYSSSVVADKIYAFFALDGRKNVGNKYWIVSKRIFAEYMNCTTEKKLGDTPEPEAGESDFTSQPRNSSFSSVIYENEIFLSSAIFL